MSHWTPIGTGDPAADEVVSLAQLEGPAAERLAGPVWNYVAGGAGDETALRDATAAWRRRRLSPRTMVSVAHLDTTVELLGLSLDHPIHLAPSATHVRYHPGAELETLRGAAAAGAVMSLSTLGSTRPAALGALASELGAPWWMQVYLQSDRSLALPLLDEAVQSGARALVLTVDTPSLGARDRDRRDSLGAALGVTYPNLPDVPHPPDGLPPHRRIWNPHLANDVTPDDITRLRDRYDVPVVVKGLLRADDARRAVDAGASAVIVSNHGARNLDTVVATADALAAVVAEVGAEVPVIVDGGIRRGTDIATALCLGADAVMIGRPVIWGLATYGARGVTHVVEMLRTELEMAMALLGAPRLDDLTVDLLT